MFNNIGKKIKALALILAGIGFIFSIVYFIVLIKESLLKVGINTVVLIAVISFVGSFILYGFGELVENSKKLVELKEKENKLLEELTLKNEETTKKVEDLKEKKAKSQKSTKNTLKASNFLEEKIKKVSKITKAKREEFENKHKDWVEEISDLDDKELIKRIDNDQDWQYTYVVLCCLEYNRRIKGK